MLLQQQRLAVETENDIVLLTFVRATIRLSYGSSLQIADGLKLAANIAAREAGVPYARRDELASAPTPVDVPLSTVRRATNSAATGLRWEVKFEGSLVTLAIGNVAITVEADTALTLAQWIRQRAKEAKRWAGDTSRAVRAIGHLSNAEDNYKRNLH